MGCKWARTDHIGAPRRWWNYPVDLEDRPTHRKIQAIDTCLEPRGEQASVTPPAISSNGCLWNLFYVSQEWRDKEMEVKSLA